MKCLVELRPNRKLLQPNFDGYKLSLESVPTWREAINANIDRVYPSDEQYSLIHAKLFGLHNHLICDHWTDSGVYYIDDKWNVNKAKLTSERQLLIQNQVYEIPSHIERQPGHYHVSFMFCSELYAILTDGAGSLHLTRTGNRNKEDSKWECVFSNQVLGPDICFLIVDCRIEYEDGKEIIHCLLQNVEQKEKTFNTAINWVTIERESLEWNVSCVKQLKGQGFLHYAALEPKCKGIYLVTDHPFSFSSDSSNEVTSKTTNMETAEKKLVYTWLQTSEDITLSLNLGSNCNKELLNIETSSKLIHVQYNNTELLKGDLCMGIDSDLTTWNVDDNGKLDILLTKNTSGAMWSDFLKDGDPNGEHILDPELVATVHHRLAHLCSETEGTAEASMPAFSNQQLEECDAISEENTCLVRMDAITHDVTHQAPLSVHQVVLVVSLTASSPPALGLRHDVDTCIWQPERISEDGKMWPVKHEGTLLAFGYVQSSKQQKKYTLCPPNMEYCVVCEGSRHAFIYRSKPTPRDGCELRLRTGTGENRKVNVGQQQVVSLDRDGEILGACATDQVLYILTEKNILALQMA